MFDEGDDEYDATRDIHRAEGKSRIKPDALVLTYSKRVIRHLLQLT